MIFLISIQLQYNMSDVAYPVKSWFYHIICGLLGYLSFLTPVYLYIVLGGGYWGLNYHFNCLNANSTQGLCVLKPVYAILIIILPVVFSGSFTYFIEKRFLKNKVANKRLSFFLLLFLSYVFVNIGFVVIYVARNIFFGLFGINIPEGT